MRAASCCSVEVMNGAYGRRRYGFSSTRVTSNGRPSRRAASPRAPSLVEVHDAGAGPDPAGGRLEVLAGGDPVAVERDQRGGERARALAGLSAATASMARMSQYSAERNAIRCRSRSTTIRVATDCTRPAESVASA